MLHGRAAAPLLLIAVLVAACSSGAGATTGPVASAVGAAASAVASAAAGASAAGASNNSGYDTGGYKSGGGSASAGASAAASGGGAAAGSGGLAVVTTSLGKVLAGPNGMTLYVFSPDTATTSACTGNCASTWPPLTGAMPKLGAGLDAGDFATLARADGAKQITFYGHPLYYFSGDQAAGDTKGQGIATKWHVVGSDGNPIK